MNGFLVSIVSEQVVDHGQMLRCARDWVVRIQVDLADLLPNVFASICNHDVLQVVEQVHFFPTLEVSFRTTGRPLADSGNCVSCVRDESEYVSAH